MPLPDGDRDKNTNPVPGDLHYTLTAQVKRIILGGSQDERKAELQCYDNAVRDRKNSFMSRK